MAPVEYRLIRNMSFKTYPTKCHLLHESSSPNILLFAIDAFLKQIVMICFVFFVSQGQGRIEKKEIIEMAKNYILCLQHDMKGMDL